MKVVNVIVGGTKSEIVKKVKQKYNAKDYKTVYKSHASKVGGKSYWTCEIYKKEK